ncbi:MAG: amidohydrolase family protein, partial [Pseudomonadota bacterium]
MRPIVDAHHHLWDLDACHYPWLMAKGVRRFFGDPTPIQKNYLVDDLRRDASDVVLKASVHIQVGVAEGDELRETEWLEETANEHELPSAIVAFCALEQPDALTLAEAQAAHPRVRGLRQIIGRSDEEDASTGSGGLVADARWQEQFRVIGDMGLSFDLQLTPPQVASVVDVLADTPETSVALCHCGSPWDQTPSGLKSWR